MKKSIGIIFLFCTSAVFSQSNDTLSKGNEQLLRLVAGFVQQQTKAGMAENGTPNGVKSLLGSTVKEILKSTAQKTATALLSNKLNFGNSLQFPSILQQNKEALISKGKGVILQNFKQSMQIAAGNALVESIPMMIEKAVDFNVDDLIKFANSDSGGITDIFKNANKNFLIKMITPIAKTALKASGMKKNYKKLHKAFDNLGGDKLDIDNENFLAQKIVDCFLGEMKNQERLLKQNPASLFQSLQSLINTDN